MKSMKNILAFTLFIAITLSGYAQKGTGNNSGNALDKVIDMDIAITGDLIEIKNERCTETTGRYSTGTHLIIQSNADNKEKQNIHVGPSKLVSEITDKLEVGKKVQIQAFSTEDLPSNQYIAKIIKFEGETYELRDRDLQPFWAENQEGRGGRKGRNRR